MNDYNKKFETSMKKINNIADNKFNFNVYTQFVVVETCRDADNINIFSKVNEFTTYKEAKTYVKKRVEETLKEYRNSWKDINTDEDAEFIETNQPEAYEVNNNCWYVIGATSYNTVYQIIETPCFSTTDIKW